MIRRGLRGRWHGRLGREAGDEDEGMPRVAAAPDGPRLQDQDYAAQGISGAGRGGCEVAVGRALRGCGEKHCGVAVELLMSMVKMLW